MFLEELSEQMVKTRKLKMACETQYLTMQKKYDLLTPQDK